MNESEFRELVAEMRSAQKAYFKTRSRDALERSKQLERSVDMALSKDIPSQGTLWALYASS